MNEMRTTGNIVTDHFTDASKMVGIGSGAKRGVKDYYLSRLACYLKAPLTHRFVAQDNSSLRQNFLNMAKTEPRSGNKTKQRD